MMRTVLAFIALVVTASVASAQAADGRLNTINNTKTIKIAYRTDATPFSFLNENKERAGYTVDLCKLVVLSLRNVSMTLKHLVS
jgi:ABC-type amino acid transport substrate-binding protein